MDDERSSAELNEMTDEFYKKLMDYLKHRNITLDKLCNEMRMPTYFVSKVVDRKIRARAYRTMLVRIAKYTDIYKDAAKFDKLQPRKEKFRNTI